MVTKPVKKSAVQSSSNWEQATFIPRELTAEEQKLCKDWGVDAEHLASELGKLNEVGYKVTFRWDDFNECYACWFLPPKDHRDNAGLILTGRGSSALKAFKQALYKHTALFDEIWPRGGDRRGGQDIDD